jgi:hypothetical protein
MKALKITFIVAVLFASLTSCTKQDLNEDDIQDDTTKETPVTSFTGGGIDE